MQNDGQNEDNANDRMFVSQNNQSLICLIQLMLINLIIK